MNSTTPSTLSAARSKARAGADAKNGGIPRRKVSLVFPMYNEGGNVAALRERVSAVLEVLRTHAFEIILVDDHSTDGTGAKAMQWAHSDDRVVYLRLSRNFGSHAALAAGLDSATGDCAIFLSADLQDPPEMMPELIQRWENGAKVVWAVRESSDGGGLIRGLSSKVFWWLMSLGAKEATPPAPADFALLDRQVIDAYQRITCRNESLIATICWLGFRQDCVPYRKVARGRGRSGWTFGKRLKLCIDSVVGFSYWPIRAMSVFGIGCAFGGFGLLVYTILHRLFGYTTVPGWAGLMSAMLTGMGILMVMVGILGEYLWRVLDEARGRPKYIVEEMWGKRAADFSPRGSACRENAVQGLARGESARTEVRGSRPLQT